MARTPAQIAARKAQALRAKEYISKSKPNFSELVLDNPNYNSILGNCLTWLAMEFKSKDYMDFAIEWGKENGYSEDDLLHVDEWKFMNIGKYAFIVAQDGQLTERMANSLSNEMKILAAEGAEKAKKAVSKEKMPKPVRNIGLEVADEIQDLIILEKADDESISDVMMEANMNSIDLSNCVSRINEFLSDWEDSDPQCEEMREIAGIEKTSYVIKSYKNAVKIAGMVGENLKAERKVSKKKTYKEVRAEKKVKNIKTKKIDTTYNIVSLPPEEILGAKVLLTFNTKNRRLGYYVANSEEGLSVKGATIMGFDESKSFSKITRNPERDLPIFRSAKNERRIEVAINDNIKGVKHPLNGRLNIDTTILKVFK